MNKTVLISNKTYNNMSDVGLNYCHDCGNVYTVDRLYGTINETFDYQLKAKNAFLGSFVNYWFQTTDYKKNKKLSNIKPSKSDILFNLFFWACIVALIACIIWGIAIPIINSAIKSIQLMQGTYTGVLMANDHIIGFVFDGKVVASTINSVANPNVTVADAEKIPWFYAYYNDYWLHNLPNGYQSKATIEGCQEYLRSFIIGTLGNSNATVTYLPKQLQVLMYFNSVGKSVENLNDLVFNGNVFTNLPKTNPYFGLSANDICLAGNQMAQTLLVPKVWISWFSDAAVIVPLIFTLALVVLVWLYRYQLKKVRPRTNAMSIQDYVMAKVVFAKKWKWLLRRRVPMVEGVKELNHRFLFAAGALGAGGLYFNIRLLNYMYATFRDMNIVLVIQFTDNDAGIAELQKVIAQDFQNISLTIVDDEIAAKFSSLDPSGNFFRYGGTPMNQDIQTINVVDKQTPKEVYELQFRNEVNDFYTILNEERNAKIKKSAIKMGDKINKNLLTYNEKHAIFEEVTQQQEMEDSDFIKRQKEIINSMNNKSIFDSVSDMSKKAMFFKSEKDQETK